MKFLALAALALTVSSAHGQFGSAGAPPTMPGWAQGSRGFPHSFPGGRGLPGARSNVIFLGQPWLDGGYNSQPGSTTYIVLPSPAAVAPKPVEESRPIMPLLIELRGDHFVRMQGEANSGSAANSSASSPTPLPANEVPVTLVYRDGHREQVRDYSIISGRLYTSADYLQSGSWMKSISLTALDLPATLAANREAGSQFLLPTAPNVVVTRF